MSKETVTIQFTPAKRDELRKAYIRALETHGPMGTFVFEGNEYVISYARYLLEFLDQQFAGSDRQCARR